MQLQRSSDSLGTMRQGSRLPQLTFAIAMIGLMVMASELLAVNPASPEPQDAATKMAADKLAAQVSHWEWLGPLVPVALSPFFGLACLSGIATYGPDWLQERSGIFQSQSPLNNPALFWIMALLTVFTSLPRLTKVSKPLALAADKLEAYSVAIIFLAIRLVPNGLGAANESIAMTGQFAAAGFNPLSFPIDLVMGIAAALNILVINMIKLMIEILIWLTPFPTIDALFEALNKTLVAALTGLYCYSPFLATLLNLAILAVCLLFLDATWRCLTYYRSYLFWMLWSRWQTRPSTSPDHVQGFLASPWRGYPRWTQLTLRKEGNSWRVTGRRWWHRIDQTIEAPACEVRRGLLGITIEFQSDTQESLKLHCISGDSSYFESAAPSPIPS